MDPPRFILFSKIEMANKKQLNRHREANVLYIKHRKQVKIQ